MIENFVKYQYIDLPQQEFDFDYCNKVPFHTQFENHPVLSDDEIENVKSHLTQEEIDIIVAESYYFIYDTYNRKSIAQQSDELLSIDVMSFPQELYAGTDKIIKKYVKTYQGEFSFLIGNNEYRPHTTSLFKHAHQPTFINGIENRSTFTIINPVSLVGPVTEKFKLFFTEDSTAYKMLKAPLTYPVPDDIVEIAFPKQNQALIIYFNSVNGIHWVDGLTDNNFLCHTFDSVTLRKELC